MSLYVAVFLVLVAVWLTAGRFRGGGTSCCQSC